MIEYAILAVICVLSYVLKIPYFNLPLDRDYGGHGYIAYNWLKGTGLMYRDIYESKTPGLKIIYMIIMKFMGISRKSFRQFFAVYNVFTTIAVYFLAALLGGPAAGCIAALLFALFSSVPSLWWHFSNMEAYYTLPMVLSFLFFVLGAQSHGILMGTSVFMCGLFCGITFMFKQPSVINTTAPILVSIPFVFKNAIISTVAMYSAGYCIPVAVFFVYFMVIKKTPWKKMPFSKESIQLLTGYLKTPNSQANKVASENSRRRFRIIFSDQLLLIAAGFAGVMYFSVTGSPYGLLLGSWIGCAFIAAVLSRTYIPYHYIPAVAPMCIAGAVFVYKLAEMLVSKGVVNWNVGECGAMAAVVTMFLYSLYQIVKDLLMGDELLGVYYSGEDTMYAACEEVGKMIKRTTTEKEYVYSWGHQPDIYLWSERRAPVYCIYPPITNPAIFSKEHVAEELEQLKANKPTYFVLTSEFGPFKEYEEFLIAHYQIVQKLEPFCYVFKLREQKVAAGG
jgi:hypothetical protein